MQRPTSYAQDVLEKQGFSFVPRHEDERFDWKMIKKVKVTRRKVIMPKLSLTNKRRSTQSK